MSEYEKEFRIFVEGYGYFTVKLIATISGITKKPTFMLVPLDRGIGIVDNATGKTKGSYNPDGTERMFKISTRPMPPRIYKIILFDASNQVVDYDNGDDLDDFKAFAREVIDDDLRFDPETESKITSAKIYDANGNEIAHIT